MPGSKADSNVAIRGINLGRGIKFPLPIVILEDLIYYFKMLGFKDILSPTDVYILYKRR